MRQRVDPGLLDTAAVLAAHVAASLDAAFALQRERLSAVTDPLTRILNRRGFEERLERALAVAQEQRIPLSLLVIDCDDFKEINDRAGHEFGDALLREVADVLSRALPGGAEAARLGGDEFVVMLPGRRRGRWRRRSAARSGRSSPTVSRTRASRSASPQAISTYPFDGAKPTTLLRAADQALYAAKAAGKDRIASFRELTPRRRRSLRRKRAGRPRRPTAPREDDGSGAVLADAMAAAKAIEAEETVEGVFDASVQGARVRGRRDRLLRVSRASATTSSTRASMRFARSRSATRRPIGSRDFPLTAEVLRSGEPRTVSFVDGDVDPSEAFILRELGMNALLMLPIRVGGTRVGARRALRDAPAAFQPKTTSPWRSSSSAQAERRLEIVGDADDAP